MYAFTIVSISSWVNLDCSLPDKSFIVSFFKNSVKNSSSVLIVKVLSSRVILECLVSKASLFAFNDNITKVSSLAFFALKNTLPFAIKLKLPSFIFSILISDKLTSGNFAPLFIRPPANIMLKFIIPFCAIDSLKLTSLVIRSNNASAVVSTDNPAILENL